MNTRKRIKTNNRVVKMGPFTTNIFLREDLDDLDRHILLLWATSTDDFHRSIESYANILKTNSLEIEKSIRKLIDLGIFQPPRDRYVSGLTIYILRMPREVYYELTTYKVVEADPEDPVRVTRY